MQNVSFSDEGVVRGLHYQEPFAQTKLITLIHGEVIDVVLDLNPESKTFGEWQAFELSADDESKPNQVFIPNTYAHGFSVPKGGALVCYLTDVNWHPEAEHSIDPFDERLAIPWGVKEPICSRKDRAGKAWNPKSFLR